MCFNELREILITLWRVEEYRIPPPVAMSSLIPVQLRSTGIGILVSGQWVLVRCCSSASKGANRDGLGVWTYPRGGVLMCPTGRRPQGRPGTCLVDYISQFSWECPMEKLKEVAEKKELWGSVFSLLSHINVRK